MAEGRVRIALDTNVLLVSVSSRSRYHWIFQALLAGKFELLLSNEILMEYEEILSDKLNVEAARTVVRTLLLLPNVRLVEPFYNWNLIPNDPDDNKFVDCAVAANAHALVTHDRHFAVLKDIEFPRLQVIDVATFHELLGRVSEPS
jgi:putative PIN family toxin of toxin-antitoxin system